jgi:hypothetical protein
MGIAFLCNNGRTNVPQGYVMCTLSVLSNLKAKVMEAVNIVFLFTFYILVYEL